MKHLTRSLLLLAAGRSAIAVDSLVDLCYTKLQGSAESTGITQWLGVAFAAPPIDDLRFAAPVNPLSTTGTVDATQFKPICLPRDPSDFTLQPNTRFIVDEDCLYLNIFAPSKATKTSKVPVMYFIQGGGFQSNSNANFNGSDLASFGNMIVIQINYRVAKPRGPAKWQSEHWLERSNTRVKLGTKRNLYSSAHDAFSGNSSAPFVGAVIESASVATLRTLDQGQQQYDCLVNATGCSKMSDTLACLRSVPAASLLTENCQFNPHLDGVLIKESMFTAFAQGDYLQVPTILGTCTGTKNVPQETNTTGQALMYLNNMVSDKLTNSSIGLLTQTYFNSSQPLITFPNAGPFWRPLANAAGDLSEHCVAQTLLDSIVNVSRQQPWSYRYAVLDPTDESEGFGAYHTVELNRVFGPNNTDGFPPPSYRTEINDPIVPVTMGYWASFVRNLNPNTDRFSGSPEWVQWQGAQGGEREILNCAMLAPMVRATEIQPVNGQVVQLVRPGKAALTASSRLTVNGPAGGSSAGITPPIAAAGRVELAWGVLGLVVSLVLAL
ncbi:carboxylesterase [Xylariaceae sp. FL0255]|nr:carboxylesterase [Xylariaceae sp. FL0255]